MADEPCTIYMKTGFHNWGSTGARVYIILHDEFHIRSKRFCFKKLLFRIGSSINGEDTFHFNVPATLGRVIMIEIWQDGFGFYPDWYVESITIKQSNQKMPSVFPVHRWVSAENTAGQHHLRILEFDTFLPQSDPHQALRKREINRKREIYRILHMPGMPSLVEGLPNDENFTLSHELAMLKIAFKTFVHDYNGGVPDCNWTKLDDIKTIYGLKLPKPVAVDHWTEDEWFANQRLNGCNPMLITLCEDIPEKLGISNYQWKPTLNGMTLAGLIREKRLFYTDLAVLDGLLHKEGYEICAPIALFMLDDKKQLMPIAIQLNQEKGPENPVFYPTDDKYVWLLAKLWYNNADAAYHQSIVHLGWTHFMMEGPVLSLHRNISVSHPIFKLLIPHTLFLIGINTKALNLLIAAGGYVDQAMTIGAKGMMDLINRCESSWCSRLQGNPIYEFRSRGVADPEVLPNYHFRDDSLQIYDIIHTYVENYVDLYYHDDWEIRKDWEIQNWAQELDKPKLSGGIGLSGVPKTFHEAGFYTKDDLVMLISAVIYTCSAGHAAANFLQYEEYGFPPNYPAQLEGKVIKDKDPRTENDIFKIVPHQKLTQTIMDVTYFLSQKATKSLGYFETKYIVDPKAEEILKKFQDNLKDASNHIEERNKKCTFPYTVLDPIGIPNSISI